MSDPIEQAEAAVAVAENWMLAHQHFHSARRTDVWALLAAVETLSAEHKRVVAERDEALADNEDTASNHRAYWKGRAEKAEAEREAALAVIERARTAVDEGDRPDALRILSASLPPTTDNTEWEYGVSEVLDDGTVAYGHPVETLAEAVARRDLDRMNYPWPEEIGVGRRRKAGLWEVVYGE